MTADNPEVLNVRQAAELLGVERRMVYRLIRSGSIPCAQLSQRVWRIPRQRLLEWISAIADAQKDQHA